MIPCGKYNTGKGAIELKFYVPSGSKDMYYRFRYGVVTVKASLITIMQLTESVWAFFFR